MKTMGYIIIFLEIIGYMFFRSEPVQLPMALVDSVFITAGASLIIVDRLKPIVKLSKEVNKQEV